MRNYFTVGRLWLWEKSPVWIWVETVVLTVATLLVCAWVNPRNPLFVHSIFPWPWLAAVVVVLRYGFGPGVVAAALITAAIALLGPSNAIMQSAYQDYLLSGLILTFFCALFSSSTIRRRQHAEELLAYSQDRLNQLSHSYYLLQSAYSALEQNIITQPITLRAVLHKLQEISVAHHGTLTEEVAYRFLQLICQQCQATQAAIYLRQKNGSWITRPFTAIGAMDALISDDPLIGACVADHTICYHAVNQLEDRDDAHYLAVAPLRNQDDTLLGILAIKEMPFHTLHYDTLKFISTVTQYFVDDIMDIAPTTEITTLYPDCPVSFARELRTLLTLKHKLNVDSALVAVLIPTELHDRNVTASIAQQQRALDSTWVRQTPRYDLVVTLLPFTQMAGIQGYLTRINTQLTAHLGVTLDQQQLKSRALQLSATTPTVLLQKFFTLVEDAAT